MRGICIHIFYAAVLIGLVNSVTGRSIGSRHANDHVAQNTELICTCVS